VTDRQVRVLEEEWDWFEVLRPQEKKLACGDYGIGAMTDWMHIVRVIEARLGLGNAEADDP